MSAQNAPLGGRWYPCEAPLGACPSLLAMGVGRAAAIGLILALVTASASCSGGTEGASGPVSSSPPTGSVVSSVTGSPAASPGPGWSEITARWTLLVVRSADGQQARLVSVSPGGKAHDLVDLPPSAELVDVGRGAAQVLLLADGAKPGSKQVIIASSRSGATTVLPGDYTAARVAQSDLQSVLVRRAGAKNWSRVDLAGKTVAEYPQLTGASLLVDGWGSTLVGTSDARRQLVVLMVQPDRVTTKTEPWPSTAKQCVATVRYDMGATFSCTQRGADSGLLVDWSFFTPAVWGELGEPNAAALSLRAYRHQGSWLVAIPTNCGGATLRSVSSGWRALKGFGGTTDPLQVIEDDVWVTVAPSCDRAPTGLAIRPWTDPRPRSSRRRPAGRSVDRSCSTPSSEPGVWVRAPGPCRQR